MMAKRFLMACLFLGLTSCAVTPPPPPPPEREVERVFPSPPGEPRYAYERTLYGASDLVVVKAKGSGWLALLTGEQKGQNDIDEGLAKPQALAVHQDHVYVANLLDSSVSVFDIPQRKFYKIGAESPGVLQMPVGLSIDRDGNLFVADATANAILVFDREGKYLRSIGSPKWFSHLTNVTADPKDNRVYAIDAGDAGHRVRVFDALDGRHLFDFGSRGHGPGEFNIPYDLAVGRDGRLNVVDSGNFRVQIFDHDGKYLRSFGSAGKQPGQFSRPKEIAADADGNLYVVDSVFGNFQIFDPDGAFLFFIGTKGEDGATAKYMLPSGIDIDEDGKVYVVDQWYGKIDIFRPLRSKIKKNDPLIGSRANPSVE